MITQEFLNELESALLRSYAKALRNTLPRNQRDPNFLGSAHYKEDFVKEFMAVFQLRQEILQQLIEQGGHRDPVQLMGRVSRAVEDKVRTVLTQKMLSHKTLDETAFRGLLRDFKTEVRSVFYEGYLGK